VKPETPEQRRAHEKACLEEVKRQAYNSPTLTRDRTIIHDVRLEGTFPNTRLLVDVQQSPPRGTRRDVFGWKLWDEGNGDFGDPAPDGLPTPPSLVARDVMVFLYEF
jgi:hypothetical protein